MPSITAQIILFAVVSVLCLLFVRPVALRYLHRKKGDKVSNADAIIGRIGRVSEAIEADGFGRVAIDGDDWSADPFYEETVAIYPFGEDKVEKVKREAQKTDVQLFDTDAAAMSIIGYDHNDILGFVAKAYVENKTDHSLIVMADSSSVNGFMVDPFGAVELPPGTWGITSIYWDDDDLAENDIEKPEDIKEIELTIHVYDSENWGDYLVDDSFKIEVK